MHTVFVYNEARCSKRCPKELVVHRKIGFEAFYEFNIYRIFVRFFADVLVLKDLIHDASGRKSESDEHFRIHVDLNFL